MVAPSHVFTIARRMLGEDEAWLEEIALELEPEDGRLHVCDLNDDDVVTAFPSASRTSRNSSQSTKGKLQTVASSS
jgi:hypothetical protein